MATGRWWQNSALCKYYARAAVAMLVSVGQAGFVGTLNWHALSGVYHVGLGLILAYVGFVVRDREMVRQPLKPLANPRERRRWQGPVHRVRVGERQPP